MDDIASSPEVVTSSLTTSFESNEVSNTRRDPSDPHIGAENVPQQQQQQQPMQQQFQNELVQGSPSTRYMRSPAAGLLLSGESRRQAYHRAIAQRWSAKTDPVQPSTTVTGARSLVASGGSHVMYFRQPQPPLETSFDSVDTVETDGDVSDTSCSRPEITTTSFDSTTTTTTTTTDNNTDDVDGQAGHQIQLQYDNGYKSMEVIVGCCFYALAYL